MDLLINTTIYNNNSLENDTGPWKHSQLSATIRLLFCLVILIERSQGAVLMSGP